MPSATGQNWEKYKKEFADDEEPEKKITPLTDEYVPARRVYLDYETDRLRLGIFKYSRLMERHPTQQR